MSEIIIFTDGSCSGNGKTNSYGGIGIHFPNGELSDISKVYREGVCTNQKTELYAILIALKYVKKNISITKKKIIIKTDSEYSINCITKWANGWVMNGWVTQKGSPVLNQELIEPILEFYNKYNIEFEHVSAHTDGDDDDSIANAVADELATQATKRAKEASSSVQIIKKKTSSEIKKKNEVPVYSPKNAKVYQEGNVTVALVKRKK
jgi:ribonuclease HI